jgi:hypothetical protein
MTALWLVAWDGGVPIAVPPMIKQMVGTAPALSSFSPRRRTAHHGLA